MSSEVRKIRPLGFWSVVALIFFEVAGGPFGIEDSVRYGGATLALVGLLVLPIIWSIPEALVTAELGTMFPEDSGYVAWVTAAFGPFWGFQEGFLSWISGVIDNSIYPIYLARYLKWFIPILEKTVPLKYPQICAVCAVTLKMAKAVFGGMHSGYDIPELQRTQGGWTDNSGADHLHSVPIHRPDMSGMA